MDNRFGRFNFLLGGCVLVLFEYMLLVYDDVYYELSIIGMGIVYGYGFNVRLLMDMEDFSDY